MNHGTPSAHSRTASASSPPIVLASSSPRRSDLLAEHGYQFETVPATVAEVTPPHLTPREVVLFNARLKAHHVAPRHPESVVIGVDTIVAFEGRIFGKPVDLADAFEMVNAMTGRAHEVYSGVCLVRPATREEWSFVEITRVYFRDLTPVQIRTYHARINPLDKAGAYAAQNDDGELIDRVEGSFTNVIGLPMETLREVLALFRPPVHPRAD